MNRTSKADYKLFIEEVLDWQVTLGVTDWKIYFVHEDVEDCLAWIRKDHDGHVCTIGLSVNWAHQPVTKALIKSSARHEVLHLLTADLVHIGKYRQTTDERWNEVEHALIRRLENAWN